MRKKKIYSFHSNNGSVSQKRILIPLISIASIFILFGKFGVNIYSILFALVLSVLALLFLIKKSKIKIIIDGKQKLMVIETINLFKAKNLYQYELSGISTEFKEQESFKYIWVTLQIKNNGKIIYELPQGVQEWKQEDLEEISKKVLSFSARL